jgi:glycine betaine/proline transport system ATP-binding protein
VFQSFALLPHRSVIDNVTFGLDIRHINAKTARDTAMRWIERVGLKGFETRFLTELSGGMQQRVGLARALASDTDILLMDEAYSALDPLIRTDMQTMLLDLQQELNKTIVFITHDLDEALRLGDGIVILRDGSIIQQGSAQDILLRPADDYIRRFVQDVNRGRYKGALADGAGLPAIASGTALDVAVKRLSETGSEAARVTDAAGKTLGQISLRNVLAAL